jgi:hypothetical protein
MVSKNSTEDAYDRLVALKRADESVSDLVAAGFALPVLGVTAGRSPPPVPGTTGWSARCSDPSVRRPSALDRLRSRLG